MSPWRAVPSAQAPFEVAYLLEEEVQDGGVLSHRGRVDEAAAHAEACRLAGRAPFTAVRPARDDAGGRVGRELVTAHGDKGGQEVGGLGAAEAMERGGTSVKCRL